MDYIQEKHGAITLEVVNIQRATLNDAAELKKILLQDIDSGCRKIIVDLKGCEFIDSTFLGTLVVVLKKITGLGGDLRLVGFHPVVNSMFQLTKMDRIFQSFPTREAAVNSFI